MNVSKRKGLAAVLAAIGSLGFIRLAAAATIAFNNGAGDGQYSNPANWNPTHVPGDPANGGSISDTVGAAGAFTIDLNSPQPNVMDVRLANGGSAPVVTLNVSNSASLLLVGDAAAFGTANAGNTNDFGFALGRQNGGTAIVNISGGVLATAANDSTGEFGVGQLSNSSGASVGILNMTGGAISSAQNFVVGDQATYTNGKSGTNLVAVGPFFAKGIVTQSAGAITAGGTAGAGSVIIGNNGIGAFTLSGGTLSQLGTGTNLSGIGSQNSTARVGFYVARGSNSVGTFIQTGGTVNVSNGLYVADGNGAKGSYTLSGGTLNIAGELRVAPSTIDAGNATTLTGHGGTFSIVDHAMPTITANSLVADTAGSTLNFTMSSPAGTTLLDIVPGAVGGVAYDGVAHLTSATQVDVDNINGFTPSANSTFTLLTAGSITGLPTLVADGDAFDAATLSIVNNPDGSQSLDVTTASAPEPGIPTLIAIGGLAMARRRQRQKPHRV